MDCPKCKHSMREFEHNGITLDYCKQCGGVWFDEGEVADYFLLAKDIPSEAKIEYDYNDKGPRCPHDGIPLTKMNYIDDLELDFCIGCKGIFFDKGEVKKLETLSSKLPRKISKIFKAFNFNS